MALIAGVALLLCGVCAGLSRQLPEPPRHEWPLPPAPRCPLHGGRLKCYWAALWSQSAGRRSRPRFAASSVAGKTLPVGAAAAPRDEQNWADISSKLAPVAGGRAVATVAVGAFDLAAANVKIVGEIPSGLPAFSFAALKCALAYAAGAVAAYRFHSVPVQPVRRANARAKAQRTHPHQPRIVRTWRSQHLC